LAPSNLESPLAIIGRPAPEQPVPMGQRRPEGRNIFVSVLTFGIGFILAAAGLHLCIRDPLHLYAEMRSEKLAMMDQWRGRASSAVFGSSHVDNGFDPRVFDQEMGGTAGASTTINLGVSGGCQTEQAAVVNAFIDSLPAPTPNSQSRYVLLEITASANFTEDHLFHPRAINIYDLHAMELALAFADRNRVGWQRAFGRSAFAFVAGLLHYNNVGMLSERIFSVPLNPQLVADETTDDRRGLTPNRLAPRGSREWIADQEILAVVHSPRPRAGEVVEGHFAMLRNLANKARQKHVQIVYFVAPRLDNLDTYPTYPDSIPGPLGPIFVLNEGLPNLHPDLYRTDMWHDPLHLTEAGAGLFSKLLADDLRSRVQLMMVSAAPGSELAIH
jgi:hypothetical protein